MPEMQIVGPPGCGKTTSLARQAQVAAERYGSSAVVITSLTRAAAAEVAGREHSIPRENVATLHALCYRALGRPPLVKQSEWNKAYPAYALSGDDRAPDDDDADGRTSDGPGDEIWNELSLLRVRMVDRAVWPARVQPFWARWCDFKTETGAIDFTDMIELGMENLDIAPGAPDALFADEVQDHSRLETTLLRRWGKQAAAFVLTGDPDQAIYEWRGADPRVFLDHDPGETADGVSRRRVLSQSYRVPYAVHTEAVQMIERVKARLPVEYLPRAAEGAVYRSTARYKYPEQLIPEIVKHMEAGATVMVMGSCAYMLAPLLAVLRQSGIPFANPWRTRNGAWNPLRRSDRITTMADRLLAYLKPDFDTWGESSAGWSAEDMRRWTEHLKAKGVLRPGAKTAIAQHGADASVELDIGTIHGWLEDDALDPALSLDLDWWARSLLDSKRKTAAFPLAVAKRFGAKVLRERPRLFVGTAHSFKGSEADHVYVFPDLSGLGMMDYHRNPDATHRLFYVAMTRARETLTLCSPSSPYAIAWP